MHLTLERDHARVRYLQLGLQVASQIRCQLLTKVDVLLLECDALTLEPHAAGLETRHVRVELRRGRMRKVRRLRLPFPALRHEELTKLCKHVGLGARGSRIDSLRRHDGKPLLH